MRASASLASPQPFTLRPPAPFAFSLPGAPFGTLVASHRRTGQRQRGRPPSLARSSLPSPPRCGWGLSAFRFAFGGLPQTPAPRRGEGTGARNERARGRGQTCAGCRLQDVVCRVSRKTCGRAVCLALSVVSRETCGAFGWLSADVLFWAFRGLPQTPAPRRGEGTGARNERARGRGQTCAGCRLQDVVCRMSCAAAPLPPQGGRL